EASPGNFAAAMPPLGADQATVSGSASGAKSEGASTAPPARPAEPFRRTGPVLRAVGLRKSFRGPDGRPIEILRGLDLELAPGEQVAVVGRSGSGKSTLLNVLGCLDRADGGELWFGESCLTRAGRRALARFRGRQLGFVFQSFHLIASLTAWENVLLAAR